jgi:hypothetical protein
VALFDHLKPSSYGAESAADVGCFMLGAAIGGLADATLNFAGFAEPMVVAGLAGAGSLGLKKLIWDLSPLQFLTGNPVPTERDIALQEIRLEIELLEPKATKADHDRRKRFLKLADESDLDSEAIRRLWIANR